MRQSFAFIAFLLAAPLLVIVAPALADPPPPPPELLALMASPGHKAALLAAGQQAMATLPEPCASAEWHTTGDVGVIEAPVTGPAGQPASGMWREQLIASGCGGARAFNVLTTVQPDGSLASGPLLPGNTIAGPVLQHDSVGYAAAAFGELPPGCAQGVVTNTAFGSFEGDSNPKVPASRNGRPWRETWTLAACGKTADVLMHFAPDDTGTTISADPAAAVK
jgi:hypothetical protein